MQGMKVVKAHEMDWLHVPIGTGLKMKQLYKNEATGAVTVLVSVEKGWRVEQHVHTANEYSYIIEGELASEDGASFPQGTYWVNPRGNPHGPFRALVDSLFLTSFDGPPFAEPKF